MNYPLKSIFVSILVVFLCAGMLPAQRSTPRKKAIAQESLVDIMRAEDELRFDETLKRFLASGDSETQRRAALAAGRIGDEAALALLVPMLLEGSADEAQMAAFAIGEIESSRAAVSVLAILNDRSKPDIVRARAIEAAGKIAGANLEDENTGPLGEAVLANLEFEIKRGAKQNRDVVLHGITALIRTKPGKAGEVLVKFLADRDGRIRTDAANALARLRTGKYKSELETMIRSDKEPLARANAARAIAGLEDEAPFDILLEAALGDRDQRVRFNALNALGALKKAQTGPAVIERAEVLLNIYKKKKGNAGLNELLTISGVLGRIMEGSDDQRTIKFLRGMRSILANGAPEVEIALVRVSPSAYMDQKIRSNGDWRASAAVAAAFGAASELKKAKAEDELKVTAKAALRNYLITVQEGKQRPDMSYPAIIDAYSQYQTADLEGFLRDALKFDDVVIREAAARLLGETGLPKPPRSVLENYFALRDAYDRAENDKLNDAAMSSLTAIKKQYLKLKEIKGIQIDLFDPIKRAAYSPDYLIRRQARAIAKELGLVLKPADERVRFDEKGVSRVKRGDYVRAVSRKKATAILTTSNGKFRIELFPEAAPLTVDNFITLAKSGYFNGLAIHRVVPNFVVQDGDPRGDGSGGPGWHIRCEINQIPYERGTVGMALSGKDTGGSQWFVTHSPQPHLDGGYTVFGKVNEANMIVVDRLVRGDVIRSIEIVE